MPIMIFGFPDAKGLVRTVEVLVNGSNKVRDISALVPLLKEDSGELSSSPPGELVNS